MQQICIGTENPHKKEKLSALVQGIFVPCSASGLVAPEETADSFLAIAVEKANAYARQCQGWAISSDGGAVISVLSDQDWQPLRTKRFAQSDAERIEKLLSLMQDKTDRTVEWHEAIAVSYHGEAVFSASARAMDGVIAKTWEPRNYREGLWLCAITHFPTFGYKNYFDLTTGERALAENSWARLKADFHQFFQRGLP